MQTEREQLLSSVGCKPSGVSCSKCGNKLWQHPQGGPSAVLGPSLFGNVCIPCGRVYCDECVAVSAPICPDCGQSTAPAGAMELQKIGVAVILV